MERLLLQAKGNTATVQDMFGMLYLQYYRFARAEMALGWHVNGQSESSLLTTFVGKTGFDIQTTKLELNRVQVNPIEVVEYPLGSAGIDQLSEAERKKYMPDTGGNVPAFLYRRAMGLQAPGSDYYTRIGHNEAVLLSEGRFPD